MIRTRELCRFYTMGDSVVRALDGVDLHIAAGEFVALTGASGSGKSTFMHLIGGLDRPTSGTIEVNGQPINTLSEKKLAELRNRHIGFVFQTFNLINRTTALENVCVPLMYTRRFYSTKTARIALERVGLGARAKHKPGEMSGGECQRVAIARAIVNNPTLLLADEPTGNLDSQTSEQIINIFHQLHAEGITVVLVTHELDVAVQANRIIQMKDGLVVGDTTVDERRREQILRLSRASHQEMFRTGSELPVAPSGSEMVESHRGHRDHREEGKRPQTNL